MRYRKLLIAIVSIILVAQFAFQLFLARSDSQTTDEGVHLSAGYTYLTKRDFRFNPEHPPLVKILSALPLLALKVEVPDDRLFFEQSGGYYYDSWREARNFGIDFLYGLNNNADFILLASRAPMALLTLLLGLLIFYISSKLWGLKGGLLSLVLYVIEPLILAHGHLVTTDIGVSLGYLLALYCLWLFMNKPNWRQAIIFGLALGFLMLVKFTSIIFVPTIILLLAYFTISQKIKIKRVGLMVGKLFVAGLVAYVIIWAGYFFNTSQIPKSETTNTGALNAITSNESFNSVKKILIPRDYWKGLAMVVGHTQGGHDSFLLGEKSKTGWWYYFPVMFSAKTTISLIIIFLISLYLIFSRDEKRFKGLFFLIGAGVYLVIAMLSKADLGVRHIMPFYAILFVLCGTTTEFFLSKKYLKIALGVLILWIVIENTIVFPHYLSYYNQFYGGTQNGYKVANDSNYDWGQDLKRIKNYLSENSEISQPFIEYNWNGEKSLDYFGLSREKDFSLAVQKGGYLIVGATALADPIYLPLKNQPIYAKITPSVFVYKLDHYESR